MQDLIGTKLKTRLLKEMDLVEGGSPHKFMAWNKKANDGKGGLVYWDTDTTQWQGCNHVAPTRDQMEVVYAGTSQEATCRRSPTGSWKRPASTSIWKASTR